MTHSLAADCNHCGSFLTALEAVLVFLFGLNFGAFPVCGHLSKRSSFTTASLPPLQLKLFFTQLNISYQMHHQFDHQAARSFASQPQLDVTSTVASSR